MGQSAPQIFSGIAPGQYATLVEKAKKAGIELSGNSGTATKLGVEVAWNYSPETQQLTLHCLKTPFFMSAEDVRTKLETLVQQSLG